MTPARLPGTGTGGPGLTRDVQMTSRRLMFIQLSQLTRCPLYVSPFFSSTSCKRQESRVAGPDPVQGPARPPPRCHPHGTGEPETDRGCAALPVLTMGWFCAVFSRDRGSCKRGERPQAPPGTGTPAENRNTDRDTGHTAPGGGGEKRAGPFPRLQPPRGPAALRAGPTDHSPSCLSPGAAAAPGSAAQTAPGPARDQSERGAAPAEPIRERDTVSAVKQRRESPDRVFTTAPQIEERGGKAVEYPQYPAASRRPLPVPADPGPGSCSSLGPSRGGWGGGEQRPARGSG